MANLPLLLQSKAGLFSSLNTRRSCCDDPHVAVSTVQPSPFSLSPDGFRRTRLGGTGTGITPQDAFVPAVAEALERHCATTFQPEQIVWASAAELGSEAVDLMLFARCSAKELSSPRCPLRLPDTQVPIRWVRGIDLLDGREVYLPFSTVYIAPPACPAERFTLPISTACAAHTSYDAAVEYAIFEVCERDALSLMWLQQLPLPRLEGADLPEVLGPLYPRMQQSSSEVQYLFFDATTDLGIPTVVGVRLSPRSRRLHTLISCASSLDVAAAIRKVVLELVSFTVWLRRDLPVPAHFEDFDQFHHGPLFMGMQQHAHAFDFLVKGSDKRSLQACQAVVPSSAQADSVRGLEHLLSTLARQRMSAYAVDLSVDEAIRAGMCAVRVVVPQLQPFSWVYRSRYLGHARLYTAPAAMGYRVRSESELNSWP